MGRRKQHDTSTYSPLWHLALALPAILILTLLSRPTTALQTVPGSGCESVCNAADFGTIEDDIVCLDNEYFHTKIGKAFRKCVACGLNSTAVGLKNVTDVDYALYDLRFALSTCMFAFPIQRVSISSPCQVTCQPLSTAIEYGLSNNTKNSSPGFHFCTAGQFDDTTINNCASCYGFIPQQLFMANFLQALHIACHQRPVPGQSFYPDAVSIFNDSVIAGPSASSASTGSGSGLHGWKLALAIALPIVGGLILIGLGCFGCFIFTQGRRRRMAESGRMSRLQQSWSDGFTPNSANAYSDNVDMYKAEEHIMSGAAGGWHASEYPQQQQQMHEMERISPGVQQRHAHAYGDLDGEESTPLHSAGPGDDQTQDHNLHDRFFGRDPHEAEMEAGMVGQAVPMTPQGQYYQQQQQQQQQHQQQQQEYYPPPPQRQSRSQQPDEIGQAASSTSPRSLAGPSYAERMAGQEEHKLKNESGEWI